MQRLLRLLPLLLALTLAVVQAQADDPGTYRDKPDARALFLQHCATCHGETGDGQGVTVLDRPARSFKDGGFSFGNTPEALFRTLSTGIPGTPMPGFDSAIDEAGLRALALYVRALGPPIEETDVSGAILEVGDEPLVVRGHLPPISEGAPAHPRGLLLGTTSGLTFEYRIDDVRLLGIRQGPFVERQDWTGRGGTPLKPLGPVIHTLHGGIPGPAFQLADGAHTRVLAAKMRSTWVRGVDVGLSYDLNDESGRPWARVEEAVRAIATPKASGFERSFSIDARASHSAGTWSLSGDLIAPIGARLPWEPNTADAGQQIRAYRSESGLVQVVSVVGAGSLDEGWARIDGGVERRVVVTTLLCPQWDEATQSVVRAQVAR